MQLLCYANFTHMICKSFTVSHLCPLLYFFALYVDIAVKCQQQINNTLWHTFVKKKIWPCFRLFCPVTWVNTDKTASAFEFTLLIQFPAISQRDQEAITDPYCRLYTMIERAALHCWTQSMSGVMDRSGQFIL